MPEVLVSKIIIFKSCSRIYWLLIKKIITLFLISLIDLTGNFYTLVAKQL